MYLAPSPALHLLSGKGYNYVSARFRCRSGFVLVPFPPLNYLPVTFFTLHIAPHFVILFPEMMLTLCFCFMFCFYFLPSYLALSCPSSVPSRLVLCLLLFIFLKLAATMFYFKLHNQQNFSGPCRFPFAYGEPSGDMRSPTDMLCV